MEPSGRILGEAVVDDRLRAPEHVVRMLVAVMRPDILAPVGSLEYAQKVWAQARVHADQIWAEAYVVGRTEGLALNTQPLRIELTGEHAAAMARWLPNTGDEPGP